VIASRKRAGLVIDYLIEQCFDEEAVARVRAPSGLDIGARMPEEIALCLISEIVLERRGGSGMRMRDKLEQWRSQTPALRAARG
jgi:xanthine dehydrogenase accessory factor